MFLTLFSKFLNINSLAELLEDDACFGLHITQTETIQQITLLLYFAKRNKRILVHIHLHV